MANTGATNFINNGSVLGSVFAALVSLHAQSPETVSPKKIAAINDIIYIHAFTALKMDFIYAA